MKISKLLRAVTVSVVAGSVLILASCASEPTPPPAGPMMTKGWTCSTQNIRTNKKWWASAPSRKKAMRGAFNMCRSASAMMGKYCRPMTCRKIY